MRYLYLLFLVVLCGCKEKELTPVGREYLLITNETTMPFTLFLDIDGRFYGKALNEYWGQYHIHNNVISFSGITSTMNAGTLPQMRAEKAYFDSLTNGHSFEIKENELKIFFDEAGVLEFKLNTNKVDFE